MVRTLLFALALLLASRSGILAQQTGQPVRVPERAIYETANVQRQVTTKAKAAARVNQAQAGAATRTLRMPSGAAKPTRKPAAD